MEDELNSDDSFAFNYVICPKCGNHVLNIWHNGSVKK